jgi:hypothetical protein
MAAVDYAQVPASRSTLLVSDRPKAELRQFQRQFGLTYFIPSLLLGWRQVV